MQIVITESFLAYALVAYLLGSIPFGKLLGKLRGIDIQKHGSGNIGFANAVRVLGWRPALLVLLGDAGKGFVPVMLAKSHVSPGALLAVGAVAILGHIFPIWLKGRGGKGIATGLGVTLALSPWLALAGVMVYLATFGLAKRSAPSSIIGSWSMPLFALILLPADTFFYLGLAVLATWTHRSNIKQFISRLPDAERA